MHTGERITRIAAELFAEHGYHGTSTRMLATAAGINVGTLNYHTGGKEALYRAVVLGLHEQEQSLIDSYLESVDVASLTASGLRRLLADLIDDLIEFHLHRPEISRLWLRRWLEPEQSRLRVEQCGIPLRDTLLSVVTQASERGVLTPTVDVGTMVAALAMGLYALLAGDPADPGHRSEREPLSEFARRLVECLT